MRTKSIYLFVVICTFFLFSGCNKSPKSLFSDETEWLVQKPDNSEGNNQVFKFVDEKTISFGSEKNYKGTWIDENTFSLAADDYNVVFMFDNVEKNRIKVAILYENEIKPITEEDWSILQANERVLELIKNGESNNTPDYNLINGIKVLGDNVPAAGLYYGKPNPRANCTPIIKIEVENKTVRIETGSDCSDIGEGISTKECKLISYDTDGKFIVDAGYENSVYYYVGNGIIQKEEIDRFGDGEIIRVDFVNAEVHSNINRKRQGSIESSSIIQDYINRAFDYRILGKNGTEGKIVILEFTKKSNKWGSVFNVPDNKMWTPLYFEYKDFGNNYYVGIPKILTEQNENQRVGREYYYMNIYDDAPTNTWWEKGSGISLSEKKDFRSVKFSKRNTKAISGKNAIYVNGSEKDIKYTFYFFEESIN